MCCDSYRRVTAKTIHPYFQGRFPSPPSPLSALYSLLLTVHIAVQTVGGEEGSKTQNTPHQLGNYCIAVMGH